jgi:hypothetical protein
MSTDIESVKFKNIINVSNYKISISKQINWCLDNLIYKEKWKNIDELYNCYKIVFKNNKLYPGLNWSMDDDIRQEFTIHHFIYYLIKEVVKVFKRNSKHFTDYDIIDLLIINVKTAYEIHLDYLMNNIYDYLYPTANLQTLSNIFLTFKPVIKRICEYNTSILQIINNYENFTTWTEYDLLYNLMDYHETPEPFDSIIDIIYYEINVDIYDVIQLITAYKQTRAQERLKKYEEELIAKTWHPNRLMDWCLDMEEKSDFAVEIC